MVTISTRWARRSASRPMDLVGGLTQAHHQPALGPRLRRTSPWRRQHSERPAVPRFGRTLRVQAGHRLHVVVEDLRSSATTAATASRSPWKSGVSTSTLVPGDWRRISRMVAAKIEAPPSARSSRSTEVTTAWRRPRRATASPTRRGSSASTSPPRRPLFTAQKAHARVQVSPRIMKVAVPAFQHSPRLGQRASSQTVADQRLLTHQRGQPVDFPFAHRCPDGEPGGRRSTPSGSSRFQVGARSASGSRLVGSCRRA